MESLKSKLFSASHRFFFSTVSREDSDDNRPIKLSRRSIKPFDTVTEVSILFVQNPTVASR